MNVNPISGEILECDVIYEAAFPAIAWGFIAGGMQLQSVAPFSTGLPHEIGHFFGLDHTNLHPGGVGPIFPPPGIPPSRATYPTLDNIPSMTAAFVTGCPGSRVANPWTQDDIVGLATIYPVTAISAPGVFPAKRPLINDYGRITGRVASGAGSVFGHNVLAVRRLPDPGFGLPMLGGIPSVGTISGTARIAGGVVGATDTATLAPTSGDFRIDGIPQGNYDILVEPLGSLGLIGAAPGGTSFGEWWFDAFVNPTNNIPVIVSNSQVNRISMDPIGGGTLLNSLQLIPGTVLDLVTPIDVSPAAIDTPEAVSRPLVDIQPRTFRPPAPSLVTITVSHNISSFVPAAPGVPGVPPLRGISATWNGHPVRLGLVSSTPTPAFPLQPGSYVSTYAFLVSANFTFPAVVEATATEVISPGFVAASGRGEVRY